MWVTDMMDMNQIELIHDCQSDSEVIYRLLISWELNCGGLYSHLSPFVPSHYLFYCSVKSKKHMHMVLVKKYMQSMYVQVVLNFVACVTIYG